MDVEMVFNELSVLTAQDVHTARQWMSAFIATAALATGKFGVKQVLRLEKEEFFNMLLAPDYPLSKWCNDKQSDLREKVFFKRLLFKSPALSGFEETEIEDQYLLSEFSHNGNFASGLGIAYLLDALALSLDSDPQWNKSRIHLRTTEKSVTAHHASRPCHIRENADWIRERREKDDPWLKHGLPRSGKYPLSSAQTLLLREDGRFSNGAAFRRQSWLYRS